ncbi:hypothetical protein CEB3_c19460 [Peptococcaceae bacterium CEB3]|nr:hypothetical protein CEB3_c19460 [Peptococcaceae bacterium CEB3]
MADSSRAINRVFTRGVIDDLLQTAAASFPHHKVLDEIAAIPRGNRSVALSVIVYPMVTVEKPH